MPQRSFPTVPGLPLLGNAHQLNSKSLHLRLLKWSRQYGSAYWVRAFKTQYLVISELSVVKQILRDRPSRFRRNSRLAEVMKEIGVHGVLSSEGADWDKQRRVLSRLFSQEEAQRFVPRFVDLVSRLQNRWNRFAATGEVIDLQSEFLKLVIDATACMSFGFDPQVINEDQHQFQSTLKQVFPVIGRRIGAPFPYWRYMTLPWDRRFTALLENLKELIKKHIEHSRVRGRAGADTEYDSILDRLVIAAMEGQESLTDEELLGNMLTLMLGGQDPTAAILTWAVHFLIENPDVMARVRSDCRRVLARPTGILDMTRARDLELVDAVLRETMRLRPPLPLLVMENIEPFEIDGVTIEARTNLVVSLLSACFDNSHFSDPETFRPERWLSGHEQERDKSASMAFGWGPRYCLGSEFAMMEMRTALAFLTADYCFHKASGRPPREVLDFTMRPDRIMVTISKIRSSLSPNVAILEAEPVHNDCT